MTEYEVKQLIRQERTHAGPGCFVGLMLICMMVVGMLAIADVVEQWSVPMFYDPQRKERLKTPLYERIIILERRVKELEQSK